MYSDWGELMRNFHVVLTDGSERNIKAGTAVVSPNGALEFRNNETRVSGSDVTGFELVCAYAEGTWVMVEVERLDDKG